MRAVFFFIIASMEVNLTQEISNEGEQKGYIDDVIAEIKAVPKGEDLVVNNCCVGGDVFQGDRLNRAILEHDGHTKAIVVGLAASMGGVLLSAFDEIELDADCSIMLHKAHIPEVPLDQYTPEQKQMCGDFNRRAYGRLSARGVGQELLDRIFLSEETKDFWFTAKEAEEAGIGHVTKIERRNSQPFKVAASLDIQQIKNKYKQMSIFNKKDKAVARIVNLADGRQVIFSSESETPKVGDLLQLVGSNESLVGKVKLSDTIEATIDEENKVVDVAEIEAPTAEVSEEMVAELIARIEAIEKAVAETLAPEEDAEEVEAKAKAEAEAKAEEDEKVEAKAEAAEALLNSAKDVLSQIKTNFKLGKVENKGEKVNTLQILSESEKRAHEFKTIANRKEN